MVRPLHGRYTILGKLADGGMAEIFLANQHGAEGFQKPVVLKRILTQFSADPQFRNMLLDEAHISMSLQHSNIVQVLDLGVAAGRYFLVLELVDGWDLERILQRAHAAGMVWPPALALFVTSQICRALAYAHAKTRDGKGLGIVHRDISPNNVLISDHGEVKLADFGIAKAQRKREKTAAGVIKGKVAYMSPEQALGAGLDKRSDLFSVGSMMYRMMTDRLPFEAGNDLESLLRVQKAQFAPPEDAKPSVGTAVSSIIMRAMRLAPSERYQAADEMLADVERVLRNDFKSAGQTELKLWLEQLARKDGAESIGKHRGGWVDTDGGVVKDAVHGTDLSAGTSFELDDLEVLATDQTEISLTTGSQVAAPPPVPVSAVAAAAQARASAKPHRRRFGGFWLGAVFALGAVIGIRYLVSWAEEKGVADKLGMGADGTVRPSPSAAPSSPTASPTVSPPAPASASPSPSESAKAGQTSASPVVPAQPLAAPAAPVAAAPRDATATVENAPAVVEKPAAAPAVAEKPAADEEPDEEELLRQAVPNPENQVIGEEEAEPAAGKAAAEKHPAAKAPEPAKEPAKESLKESAKEPTKVASRTPAPKAPAPPSTRPAPAKTDTIILHISTTPVGAVVRVRTRVLGRTPINLHFRSDNVYDIVFLKSGYQPLTKRVSLTGSKDRKLAVALKKRPAAAKKRTFFHPHR
jgi:eukaryotic-like serine/threonine-protein kinase